MNELPRKEFLNSGKPRIIARKKIKASDFLRHRDAPYECNDCNIGAATSVLTDCVPSALFCFLRFTDFHKGVVLVIKNDGGRQKIQFPGYIARSENAKPRFTLPHGCCGRGHWPMLMFAENEQ